MRLGDSPCHNDCDGLVTSGEHVIDPVLYTSKPEVESLHDKARDIFELKIITYALDKRLPLLGICWGAQLLNVKLAGSLYQKLRSRRQVTSNRWIGLPLKTLKIELDSLLQCYSANPMVGQTGYPTNHTRLDD